MESASSSIIQKVAEAITVTEGFHIESWRTFEKAAKAAIKAMREPTEEMLEKLRKQGGIDGYEAMIDEALK